MPRFNPAPGWPPAPQGWLPDSQWRPDPSWPPAPAGWQVVVDDSLLTTAGGEQLAYPTRTGASAAKVVGIVAAVVVGLMVLGVVLAVPAFLNQREKVRESYAEAAVRDVLAVAESYGTQYGTEPLEPTPDRTDPEWTTPLDLAAWSTDEVKVLELVSSSQAILLVEDARGRQTGVRVVLSNNGDVVTPLKSKELKRYE